MEQIKSLTNLYDLDFIRKKKKTRPWYENLFYQIRYQDDNYHKIKINYNNSLFYDNQYHWYAYYKTTRNLKFKTLYFRCYSRIICLMKSFI
jgi:hypothetical protein